MTDLPPSWAETTLGEIADTSLGKMLDRGKATGEHAVPYLRNVNVQWGRIDLDDVLTMDISPDERDFFRLVAGDLLVCEGGEIGRCAIWPERAGYMAYQKALHRVRPHRGVEAKYLRYLMEHMSLAGLLAPYSTGSTIKHLPQQQFRRTSLHLPPTAEQCRIVAALEYHLSRLGSATFSVQSAQLKQLLLTKRLVDERLDALDATTYPLASILREPLINGRSVPTDSNGFPVLRLTALRDGRLALLERKGGRWTAADAAPFLVRKGDFFISRGNGSLSLVGRGALLEEEPDPVAFPDTMVRIRVDEQKMSSEFLRLVWSSRRIRTQIEKFARTTAGIYKINQRMIEAIHIPVPGLSLQEQVVTQVHEMLDAVDRVGGQIQQAVIRADRLRRTLLATAFGGRLVEQNPSDERASVLLERIRAERAAKGSARRTRRDKYGLAPQKETLS